MATLMKEFPLDSKILGDGSAVGFALGGSTDPATLAAIAANHPFPAGAIELGRIAVDVSGDKGLTFKCRGATVGFKSSAAFQTGIGVFDAPAEAIASLQLTDVGNLDLTLASRSNSRWTAMRWAYTIAGAVSGSHPIGIVGSIRAGAEVTRDGTYAVLHCFDATTGARDVIAATARSWRLPRHVDLDGADVNLPPETWLVADVDGTLALTMGAKLGYDVSFAHEATALGLTRDVSAKIDANLKASFGITASGRYLVVVGREDRNPASKTVRLRLLKQSKDGLDFALNLNVGLTASVPIPDTFDDFVETIFGVHGPRVLKDLRVFEEWTDPDHDIGENIARLTTRTALDLLKHATGVDPEARFNEARAKVVDALKRWDELPDGLAATTWRFLSTQTPKDVNDRFRTFLETLAGDDIQARQRALAEALRTALAGDRLEAQWLQSIADRGLLVLARDLDRVSALARATLAVMNSDVVKGLHRFVGERLDLAPLRKAVEAEDFDALHEWLITRLGAFADKKVPAIGDLRQIQQAVFGVDQKIREIYEHGLKALSKRYSAEFAATYQRSRTDTALLDVSFDLARPDSLSLFRQVLDGDLTQVLTTPTDGVTIGDATLSHGLNRTTHVELRMPFLTSEITHATKSLARLTVEEQAGRVLVYEFSASDRVAVANRARSELSVLGTVRAAAGGSPRLGATGTIAYEARQVKKRMRPLELEVRTRPFVDTYLATLFPAGGASLDAFYAGVREMVPDEAGGDEDRLGDVALSMQVSYPASVLESWLRPRDRAAVRADSMILSRAVQFSLRRLLVNSYCDNIENLQLKPSVAALLVWASMPVSTSADVSGSSVTFNTDRDVFWDYATADVRRAVAREGHTAKALAARLGQAEARLRAAGRGQTADTFTPSRAGAFIDMALDPTGDVYLGALLNAEAQVVSGATRALAMIAAAVTATGTAPSVAVTALSEFAATLVDTFNGRLHFLYSPETVRTLGPTMLADASTAIHPTPGDVQPGAMLNIYVLGRDHSFVLNDFLDGSLPPRAEVASAQTLVRL